MLKIYWSPLSTPANKVRMCANLLGLDYETVTVNLPGGEQLGKTQHLAGELMTIADLAVLNGFDNAEVCEVDLSAAPNLCEWRKRLRAEAFYQSVHTHFGAGIIA